MKKTTAFSRYLFAVQKSLVTNNLNRLSIFVGKPGSGKSAANLSIAYLLNRDTFSIKHNVAFFDPWDFLDLVDNAEKGDVIVWDDAGNGLDSRTFGSQANIIATQLMNTFRPKNTWNILNTPHMGNIDLRARQLFTDYVKMLAFDKEKLCGKGAWKILNVRDYDGTIFRNHLKIDGRLYSKITFPAVPDEIWKEYDKAREKSLKVLFDKAKDLQFGGDKDLPIAQSAGLLGMNTNILWSLVTDRAVPVSKEARAIVIPLGYIRRIRNQLKFVTGDEVVLSEKKLPTKACFKLLDGRYLIKW